MKKVVIPRSVLAQLERHAAEGKIYRGLSPDDLDRLMAGAEIDLDAFAVPREKVVADTARSDAPDERR
jgi:hypothetical protein